MPSFIRGMKWKSDASIIIGRSNSKAADAIKEWLLICPTANELGREKKCKSQKPFVNLITTIQHSGKSTPTEMKKQIMVPRFGGEGKS